MLAPAAMRLRHFPGLAAVGLALFVPSLAAHAAQEVNVTEGIAIRGHDPVAYFTEGRAVRGEAAYAASHEGATYHFASAAHRDAFRAEPARYLPQYGGYCAFGASRGYKADANPAAWKIVEGRLYLNYNGKVQAEWLKDPAGYIRAADRRWDEVRRTTQVFR